MSYPTETKKKNYYIYFHNIVGKFYIMKTQRTTFYYIIYLLYTYIYKDIPILS